MKEAIKTVAICALGLVLGLGAVKAYQALTRESPVIEGDFTEHIENAGEEIVLYATTTCSFCEEARNFLEAHDVAFAEILLDRQPSARSEALYASFGRDAVPIVVRRDRQLVGFSEERYRSFVELDG